MKLPFTFAVKFLLRLVLPGFLLAIVFRPAFDAFLVASSLTIHSEYIYIVATLLLGWLVIVADMHIYMFYEGRRYWLPRIREFYKRKEQKRLERLLAEEKNGYELSRKPNGDLEGERLYREASVEVRRFPVDKNYQPTARWPTRIGNLIHSYEQYPDLVYGMDSVFYWPRLACLIDKDLREEIDNSQAFADSAIYVSFCMYVGGFACIFYFLLKSLLYLTGKFQYVEVALPSATFLLVMAPASFLGGYLLYRLSLHTHAKFGEIFKAAFDNYSEKLPIEYVVKHIVEIADDKSYSDMSTREKYKAVWRYLHNYRIRSRASEQPSSKLIGEYLENLGESKSPHPAIAAPTLERSRIQNAGESVDGAENDENASNQLKIDNGQSRDVKENRSSSA